MDNKLHNHTLSRLSPTPRVSDESASAAKESASTAKESARSVVN